MPKELTEDRWKTTEQNAWECWPSPGRPGSLAASIRAGWYRAVWSSPPARDSTAATDTACAPC